MSAVGENVINKDEEKDQKPSVILAAQIRQFSSQGDIDALVHLTDSHPNIIDLKGVMGAKGGNTALHYALSHNQQGDILDFLLQKGSNVNAFNSKGYNPIFLAIVNCKSGGTQAIRKLIASGADLDCRYRIKGVYYGLTPLEVAQVCQNIEVIPILKQALQEQSSKPKASTLGKIDSQEHTNGSHESSKSKSIKSMARGARAICPICQQSVKFPSRLAFLQADQEQAERDHALRIQNVVDGSRSIKQSHIQRAYLDQFLASDAFAKLSQIEYHGVNNMHKLRKEISESYAMLEAIHSCIENPTKMFVIDLCAGKSLTTALGGALYPNSNFLAVDKLPTQMVPHFHAPNTTYRSRDINNEMFARELISDIEFHQSLGASVVLVGMHLCGNLSKRAIQFYAEIPSISAMVLCPCCLPNQRSRTRNSNDTSFMAKGNDELDQYRQWCMHLKETIELTPSGGNVALCNNSEMHSVRNCVITVSR